MSKLFALLGLSASVAVVGVGCIAEVEAPAETESAALGADGESDEDRTGGEATVAVNGTFDTLRNGRPRGHTASRSRSRNLAPREILVVGARAR
ncbi:hypothetical protein [Polyangium jinanense]|uniref:Lipoprotein n=1 Tax=Polyangium jinanense TaxID=2829994 RepID=A0A9X3X9M1_9BACT|nr:hypothetical protein [Polyangium jinanense]MDC3960470.1 hypothetical protein [Polyangium jinanense]MDC3986757.1 hypothetical protein [Polyangium jinanense]